MIYQTTIEVNVVLRVRSWRGEIFQVETIQFLIKLLLLFLLFLLFGNRYQLIYVLRGR